MTKHHKKIVTDAIIFYNAWMNSFPDPAPIKMTDVKYVGEVNAAFIRHIVIEIDDEPAPISLMVLVFADKIQTIISYVDLGATIVYSASYPESVYAYGGG